MRLLPGFRKSAGRSMNCSAIRAESVLTIACSYDVAHLWLMPRHERVAGAVGARTDIRVVASEYEHQAVIQDDTADIALTYLNPLPQGLEAVLLLEKRCFRSVRPVARSVGSRGGAFPAHLRQGISAGRAGRAGLRRRRCPGRRVDRRFSSYVYLLEAAADGAGMALGWSGLVDALSRAGAAGALSRTA